MALARKISKNEWMRNDRISNRDYYLTVERESRARARIRLGVEGWKRCSKQYNLKKYNLTLAQFDELLKIQDSKCAICLGPPGTKKGFHVDHDHVTDKVRGLLCHTCNQGMISFDRVEDWASKATRYAQNGRGA